MWSIKSWRDAALFLPVMFLFLQTFQLFIKVFIGESFGHCVCAIRNVVCAVFQTSAVSDQWTNRQQSCSRWPDPLQHRASLSLHQSPIWAQITSSGLYKHKHTHTHTVWDDTELCLPLHREQSGPLHVIPSGWMITPLRETDSPSSGGSPLFSHLFSLSRIVFVGSDDL